MDPQISFVLASIASGLASVCVVLSLWSFVRQGKLEAHVDALDDKLPPKRVRELEAGFDAMVTAFEGLQQKNTEWKQSVHQSVQRMDQIMRRNEAAQQQVLTPDGELSEEIVKGELPVGLSLGQPDQVELSKQAALRARWNKNRGI